MAEANVPIVERILNANDHIAAANRARLDRGGILALNVMASPGAGKTSLILRTIEALSGRYRLGVIEGDTAPVTIDAEKVLARGIPAVQVNTGGGCHLDAVMVGDAFSRLPMDALDILFVENVGNLICPAAFQLGTHLNVLVASVTEGDDKPYKYPKMYRNVDVLLLNKVDLLPHLDFRRDYYTTGVTMLNPQLEAFDISCRTGAGIARWISWLEGRKGRA
jgi:hydrogenase nickel incorporation protein HypB